MTIKNKEEMKLENMMKADGWKQTRRSNAGVIYVEWHKQGFIIDDEDILEDK